MPKHTLSFTAIGSFFALLLLLPPGAFAQAQPSAYLHRHTIYVGAEYALYDSDYFGGNKSLNQSAFAIYGDYYIFNGKWPIALDLNYTKVPDHYGNQQRYLSSFLSGIKLSRRFGRLEPFAKVGAGIGHLSAANLISTRQDGEHFAIGFGGGFEYRLTSHIMLRPVDYTYERWNFYPNALAPQILGFGLSYRIH